MNSLLRIRIQVAVQQAREVAKLQGQLKEIGKAAEAATKSGRNQGVASGLTSAANAAKLTAAEINKANRALERWNSMKVTSKAKPIDFSGISRNLAGFGQSSNVKQGQKVIADAERAAKRQAAIAERAAKQQAALSARLAAQQAREQARAAAAADRAAKQALALATRTANQQQRQAARVAAAQAREAARAAAVVARLAARQQRQAEIAANAAVRNAARAAAAKERADKQAFANWQRYQNRMVANHRAANEQMVRLDRERIQHAMKMHSAGGIDTGAARKIVTGITSKDPRVVNDVAVALAKLDKAQRTAAASAARLADAQNRNRKSMMDTGRQVQWTGRQLEYNFTIPLARAATGIFELQRDTDKAMTRIVKVYGDGGDAADELSVRYMNMGINMQTVNRGAMAEGEQMAYDLGRAFRMLSDAYGVSIDQVGEIGSMWAQAGYEGTALAKQVRLTMELMTVGEMEDPKEAVKGLIQIQAAYGFSTDEMRGRIAQLNLVENQTKVSTEELIKATARGGSVAASSGVSWEQHVGMIAQLVPAYGSAETAGNALKTLYSRILVPAAQAADVIELMGINVEESGWNSVGAVDRMQILAKAYEGLSDQQKMVASTHMAGRYQLNKFDGAMKGLADTGSDYHRVQELIKDGHLEESAAMEALDKEIATYLSSTSKGIEIMKTRMMNAASAIVANLLPAIFWLISAAERLVQGFADLDPGIKRIVLIGVVALAAAGPIMRLGGAFMQLFGVIGAVGKAFIWLKSAMAAGGALAFLTNPWFLLAAAIVAAGVAAYIYRDKVVAAVTSLWNGYLKPWLTTVYGGLYKVWQALPKGIHAALVASWNIIKTIGLAIYKALQRLNPFARHSPSLVDNVIAGVDLIARKYASLSNIGNVFRRATADMAAFGAATAGLMASQKETERNEIRTNVATAAPEASGALEGMFGSQDALEAALKAVGAEVDAQKSVVAALDAQYKDLERSLDVANAALAEQRELAEALKGELDAAQSELDRFSNMQITGMQAASDASFENEMAIKRIRLAIMDMEDAGGSIEDIKQQMADLAGEIETLQGLESDLRQSGAGSEITGPIRERITALQAEADAVRNQAEPYNDLEAQLKALQRQGERMDLENSLKFDPLTRQIEKMTTTMEEMPFDEIVRGITTSKGKVDQLTRAYENSTKQVQAQERVVKDLEDARKTLSGQMDVENAKLAELQTAYDGLNDQLAAVTAMLGDIVGAADAATEALEEVGGGLSDLAEDWAAAADEADFAIDPSLAGPSEEEIQAYLDRLEGELAEFDLPNPFDKVGEYWDKFKGWWGTNVQPWIDKLDPFGDSNLGDTLREIGEAALGMKDNLVVAVSWAKRKVEEFWGKLKEVWAWEGWDFLKEEVPKAWENIKTAVHDTKEGIKNFWKEAEPKLEEFKELAKPLQEAWDKYWRFYGTALASTGLLIKWFVEFAVQQFNWLMVFLLPLWRGFWAALAAIIGPYIDVIVGTAKFFLGILTGDWDTALEGIKQMLSGWWNMAKALWDLAYDYLKEKAEVVVEWLKTKWQDFKDKVKQKIQEWWDDARQIFDNAKQGIIQRIKDAVDDVKQKFTDMKDDVKEKLRQWWGDIASVGDDIKTLFTITIPGYIDALVNAFGGIKQRVIDAVINTGTDAWNAMQVGFSFMKTQIGDVVDDIVKFFSDLPGDISSQATNVWNAAVELGRQIISGIGSGVSGIAGGARDIATAITSAIESQIESTIRAIERGINNFIRLVNALPDFLQIPHINPISIPIRFHQGGPVPGIAGQEVPAILQAGEYVLSRRAVAALEGAGMLGENGISMKSEAPLPNGTGSPKVIVFNGDLSFPNITSGDDAERFLRNLEALAVN